MVPHKGSMWTMGNNIQKLYLQFHYKIDTIFVLVDVQQLNNIFMLESNMNFVCGVGGGRNFLSHQLVCNLAIEAL